MARSKTMITVLAPVEDMVEGCNDLRAMVAVDDQPAALKWVKEHGNRDVEYVFARFLRTATKKVEGKKMIV